MGKFPNEKPKHHKHKPIDDDDYDDDDLDWPFEH